jgi:hypothetical protein
LTRVQVRPGQEESSAGARRLLRGPDQVVLDFQRSLKQWHGLSGTLKPDEHHGTLVPGTTLRQVARLPVLRLIERERGVNGLK